MSIPHLEYPLAADEGITRVMQWGLTGPSTLLLHGLGSHAGIFRALAPLLAAAGRRVLAVDLPGPGLSSKGARFEYDLAGHVRWLGALSDGLLAASGESTLDLVGSSLGGLWAAGFATTHPDRIRSLALIGAIGLQPLAPERRRFTADYLGHMEREAVAERLRHAVAAPAAIPEALIEECFHMNNSPGAAAAFAAIGRYYLGRINEDLQLDRLASRAPAFPVRLLWGVEDTVVPLATARAAAARIPACTLHLIEAAGHIPHWERPLEVVRALGG
jgi:pimeloyl-ACP methyl ester carboxylesterase